MRRYNLCLAVTAARCRDRPQRSAANSRYLRVAGRHPAPNAASPPCSRSRRRQTRDVLARSLRPWHPTLLAGHPVAPHQAFDLRPPRDNRPPEPGRRDRERPPSTRSGMTRTWYGPPAARDCRSISARIAGCRIASRRCCESASSRTAAAQARAVEPAVSASTCAPNASTTAASAGVPGSTTSRAMTSVSITGTPRSAKRMRPSSCRLRCRR